MMNSKTINWRKAGKHLPKFMRDFHDQKDLFKSIEQLQGPTREEVSWVDNHIYVVDHFLWFMARHGYTLQKVRGAGDKEFDDVNETVESATYIRRENEAKVLKDFLEKKNAD